MKFKYIGALPLKDVDLVRGGVFKPNQSIYNGTVFEVPDANTALIAKVKLNGVYEEYIEPKKPRFAKKIKKEEKEEDVKEDE